MTKWKEQIDTELGLEPKFHDGLKGQIAERARQSEPIKRMPKRYVATLVGACLVALLIILTWQPEQRPQQAATVPLLHDIEDMGSVDALYINHFPSESHHFNARASSLYLGVKKYSSEEQRQIMTMILQNAQLAEKVENIGNSKDVVVKFANGEQLKLKVFNDQTEIGILDLRTQLYYKVDEVASVEWMKELLRQTSNSINMSVVAFIGSVAQSSIPWLVGLKKQDRRKKALWEHVITALCIMALGTIVIVNTTTNFLISGYVMAAILLAYFTWNWLLSKGTERKVAFIYILFYPIWAILFFIVS